MSIIHSLDNETSALSGIVAGAILTQAASQLESLSSELSWTRPRAERGFSMISAKRIPRYAIYDKTL